MAVNLSTTGLIEKVAARHGGKVFRTPVGEANVVETLLAEGCVLGGEGNGGVIYPAVHAGRDALVGIAMILQALAEHGGDPGGDGRRPCRRWPWSRPRWTRRRCPAPPN